MLSNWKLSDLSIHMSDNFEGGDKELETVVKKLVPSIKYFRGEECRELKERRSQPARGPSLGEVSRLGTMHVGEFKLGNAKLI